MSHQQICLIISLGKFLKNVWQITEIRWEKNTHIKWKYKNSAEQIYVECEKKRKKKNKNAKKRHSEAQGTIMCL